MLTDLAEDLENFWFEVVVLQEGLEFRFEEGVAAPRAEHVLGQLDGRQAFLDAVHVAAKKKKKQKKEGIVLNTNTIEEERGKGENCWKRRTRDVSRSITKEGAKAKRSTKDSLSQNCQQYNENRGDGVQHSRFRVQYLGFQVLLELGQQQRQVHRPQGFQNRFGVVPPKEAATELQARVVGTAAQVTKAHGRAGSGHFGPLHELLGDGGLIFLEVWAIITQGRTKIISGMSW